MIYAVLLLCACGAFFFYGVCAFIARAERIDLSNRRQAWREFQFYEAVTGRHLWIDETWGVQGDASLRLQRAEREARAIASALGEGSPWLL